MHIIRRQTLQIDLKASQKQAFELQAVIQKVYEENLLPLLSERFDALTQSGETVYIPRLVLDLGDINLDNLEASLTKALEKAWDKWLKELPFSSPQTARNLGLMPNTDKTTPLNTEDIISKMQVTEVRRLGQAERLLRSLSFFLKNGRLPWWEVADADTDRNLDNTNTTTAEGSTFEALLKQLISIAPKNLVETLTQLIAQSPSVLQRLLWQSSSHTQFQLIDVIWSKLDKQTHNALIELLRSGGMTRQNAEASLSEALIRLYFQDKSPDTSLTQSFWLALHKQLDKQKALTPQQQDLLWRIAENKTGATINRQSPAKRQHSALIVSEAPLAYNSELDILRYFLQKGSIPIWANLPNAEAFELWLSELINVESDGIKNLLWRLSQSPEAEVGFRRLATRLNDEQFEQLSALLLPPEWLPVYHFLWKNLAAKQNLAGRTAVAVSIKTFVLHIRYWQNIHKNAILNTEITQFIAQLSQFLAANSVVTLSRWEDYIRNLEPRLEDILKPLNASNPIVRDDIANDDILENTLNEVPEEAVSPQFSTTQDAQVAVWLAWAQSGAAPWWAGDALNTPLPDSFVAWTQHLLQESPTLIKEALRLSSTQRRQKLMLRLEQLLPDDVRISLVNSLQPNIGGFAMILRELSLQTTEHLAPSFNNYITSQERQSWQILLETLAQDQIADSTTTSVNELALQAIRLSAKRYRLAPEALMRLWMRLAQDLEDDFPRLAAVANILDQLLRRPAEVLDETERVITPLNAEQLPDTDIEKQALSTWRHFLQQQFSPNLSEKNELLEAFRQLTLRRIPVLTNLLQTNLLKRQARQQIITHFPDLIPAILSLVQRTPFANLTIYLNDVERFFAGHTTANPETVQTQFYNIVLMEAVAGPTRQLDLDSLSEKLLTFFQEENTLIADFWQMPIAQIPQPLRKAYQGLKALIELKENPQTPHLLDKEEALNTYLEQYRTDSDSQMSKDLELKSANEILAKTNTETSGIESSEEVNSNESLAETSDNPSISPKDKTAQNQETEQQSQARLRRLAMGTLKNSSTKSKKTTSPKTGGKDKKGTKKAAEEVYFVNNAGLVILHPFLPQFFRVLNLDLKNPEQAMRAVHLLQYIVTKKTHTPEEELTLNKLICGIPLGTPITAGLDDISEQERQTADMIIQAATGNWAAMKNTSVDNFRVTFLQRGGRITETSEAFVLRVNSSPLDLLLQTMPWAMGILRYSWMPKMISVEWAAG